MKSSYTALGVVGLAIAGLWYAGGGTVIPTEQEATARQMHVSKPVTHENLTVFFIHGPDLLVDAKVVVLQEAIESGWAVVHETGNVNVLTVENRSSEYELFMQEGDIIRGGRQDRMIARDMLLPPKSGLVSFPCNCVEQGRWTGRGNEAATYFNKSDQFAVGNNQKHANINLQQGAVWNSVEEKQKELAKATQTKVTSDVSVTSFQLTLESPVVKAMIAEYEAVLESKDESRTNVLGVVFFVNGEMTGAEVYGSNALFQKAWPKFLRSAAIEALVDKKDKRFPPAPSSREVERFLANACQFDSPAIGSPQVRGNPAGLFDSAHLNTTESALEVFQTEGRPEILQTEGRVGGETAGSPLGSTTLSTLGSTPIISAPTLSSRNTGSAANSSSFLTPVYGNPTYAGVLTNSQFNNNSPGGFGSPLYNGPGMPTQTEGRPVRDGRVGRVRIEGNVTMADRVILNQIDAQPGQVVDGTHTGAGQASNPVGNQLNITHIENAAGLVTESRDPTRQNAIIHKSIIKLGSNQK